MSRREGKKKKNRVLDLAYRVIITCLIIIIAVSGYKLGTLLYKYYVARSAYDKVTEAARVDTSQFTGEIDWDALRAVNGDIQAWIYLKDSEINYPVVKGKDNDQYLHRLIDGNYNFAGTIFMDYRNSDGFSDFNTIVYGHHMKDGSMFAGLSKYLREDGFYDKHKQFEVITPDEKYHLLVFSAFVTKATGDVYKIGFNDDLSKREYTDMLRSSSYIETDEVEIDEHSHLAVLSTCVAAEGEDRYIVAGKLVPWSAEEKAEALEIQKAIDEKKK